MTGRIGKAALTLAALIAAGAAAWHAPALATRLGMPEMALVAGLIAAIATLTAVERLYDRLGLGADHTRPGTGSKAPVTPDAASDSK